jgi:hypothetical protein
MALGVMTPSWHGGAAAVATLTFDVDAETPILAHGGHYADHMTTMSHQSYGPDVGVPRILDMLDELEVPATFFVPGWVAEQRPGLAAAIVERGHEVAHHSYSHRSPVTLTPAEERADFERALAVFAEQGIDIRGHRAACADTDACSISVCTHSFRGARAGSSHCAGSSSTRWSSATCGSRAAATSPRTCARIRRLRPAR